MALTVPVAEIVENNKNPLLGKHESWGRVLLGEIATIQNGFPFKSSQFTKSEGMPLIRIRDVGADYSDTNYVGDYDPAFLVKAGDLLIGMDGDFNCARWRGPDGLLNQRVCRVILKSDIYHPKLLDYALPGYLKAINDMTSSVTVKHLSSKSIAEIPLPLPPIDQQKRIVAEIEKQFSRLDEAVANLKRVKANLKRYKAAVLKAAVEGRLVETEAERARREGRIYETGEQLLQRILETRRSQWQGKGKYKEPAAPDTTDLPELPEGWVWCNGSQLFSWSSGVNLPVKNLAGGDFPVYGGNGVNGWHTEANVTHPTLVIGRVGAGCGNVNVLNRKAWVTDNAIYAAWIHPDCNLSYLGVVFTTANLNAVAAGSGQPFVNQTILNVVLVAMPPVAEQQIIMAEIERSFSIADEAESQINANLQRAQRLRQSILTKAFTGGLQKADSTSKDGLEISASE